MVKIRLGSDSRLREFSDQNEAFTWVRENRSEQARHSEYPFIFSVLVYEQGRLETMDRFYFDGNRFSKEQVLS